jgi:hypothetical protein
MGDECRHGGTVYGQRWPRAVMWRRDTMRWYLLCTLSGPSVVAPAS